ITIKVELVLDYENCTGVCKHAQVKIGNKMSPSLSFVTTTMPPYAIQKTRKSRHLPTDRAAASGEDVSASHIFAYSPMIAPYLSTMIAKITVMSMSGLR
ncbi:MAG TPA: hypothetical protein VGO47_08765, partial [Chlamydiales bacterium]|nr:hypothetical protein [Chlamydiales bacterium]